MRSQHDEAPSMTEIQQVLSVDIDKEKKEFNKLINALSYKIQQPPEKENRIKQIPQPFFNINNSSNSSRGSIK